MYKVGLVGDELFIYNSDIGSSKLALDQNNYIAKFYTEFESLGDNKGKYQAVVWNYDSYIDPDGCVSRFKDIFGLTIESTFFKMQLALVRFGFEGIMDLELPEECQGV